LIYWPLQNVSVLPNGRTFPSYGRFAEATVIAHEFGHYIQDITGILAPVNQRVAAAAKRHDDLVAAWWNQDLELQADCFAGKWVRSEWDRSQVDPADLANMATLTDSIGDDAINPLAIRRPTRRAHGTSEQRARWLEKGLLEGNAAACSTWSEPLYRGFRTAYQQRTHPAP
jgi:predicted metalloprotease